MASKDIEAVFLYTQSQNISIDKQEFEFQIETHPDYPSLLAFSDTLNFFDIPNIAFNFSFEELNKLPNSFVVLLGEKYKEPSLYHITKQGNYYLYKEGNKSVKATKEELQLIWKNVVLLVEKSEQYTENKKTNVFSTRLYFAVLIALTLSVVLLFSQSIVLMIFGGLICIGLFLSIEALKIELGIESAVSEGFCNIIPNADCSQVINSIKSKSIDKVKISDISFWFFTSQFFTLFIFSVSNFVAHFLVYTFISLVLSLPMTLYSIYFQYKIEQKWCPICLSIIGIVYLELLFLLFLNIDFQFSMKSFVLFFTIFSVVLSIFLLLKPVFIDKKYFKDKYVKQLRFSRNYKIFKNLLLKSDIQFFDKEFIVLGNSQSKKKISIITSPLCGFCKDAHYLLDNIIYRFRENIAVSIRFNFDEDEDVKTKDLFLRLAEIYSEEDNFYFMEVLRDWFEYKNLDDWFIKFGKPKNNSQIETKLKEIAQENSEKELNFTPNIFLNQYNFPKEYERENLEYIISDWLDDEEI